MADYYPLIARAIAGLDPSAPGESRRALYERARAALIAQLRSVQPPLERIRDHPRAAVAGRGRAQGRIRGRPARPGRHPLRWRRGRAAAPRRRCVPRHHPPQCAARRSRATAFRVTASAAASAAARAAARRATTVRRSDRKTGQRRSADRAAAQPARRRAAAAAAAAASPDAGSAAAADPRTHRRAAPRPDNSPRKPPGAGHARLSRHRRRCRRSRPRRGAGQPRRAKNLCQRAVAVAGVRPARAEHGEPRRRSRRALFV